MSLRSEVGAPSRRRQGWPYISIEGPSASPRAVLLWRLVCGRSRSIVQPAGLGVGLLPAGSPSQALSGQLSTSSRLVEGNGSLAHGNSEPPAVCSWGFGVPLARVQAAAWPCSRVLRSRLLTAPFQATASL